MKHLVSLIMIFVFCCIMASCNSKFVKTADESLPTLEKVEYYESLGDTTNAMLCYLNAIDMLSENHDTILKATLYTQFGDFQFKYGLYEKAIENHRKGYNIALRINDSSLACKTAGKIGIDYLMLNQKDTAQYYLHKCRQMADKNNLHEILYEDSRLYSLITEDKSLNSMAHTIKSDTLGTLQMREKLITIETDFIHNKALIQEKIVNRKRLLNTASGILLVGACSALSFFFYRGKKIALSNLNNALMESNSREKYISCREDYLMQQESKLKIKEEQLLSDCNIRAIALINRLKSSPTYMSITSQDDWHRLFTFAESLYPGFRKELDSVNGLTIRDKEISCLVKLGFTTGQLAIFYGISPGSVTKAKYRIQKKIESVHNPRIPFNDA